MHNEGKTKYIDDLLQIKLSLIDTGLQVNLNNCKKLQLYGTLKMEQKSTN